MLRLRLLSDHARAGSPRLFEGRGGGLNHGTDEPTPLLHPSPLSKGRGDFCMPLSQNSCLLEAEISGASFRWRADDNVIEQFDLQQLRSFGQTACKAVVGLAR